MKPAIITFVVSLLLIFVVSMAYADEPQKIIDVQHDSVRGVTCWILNGRAISCLPDSQLRQPYSVSNSDKARPNPASATMPPRGQENFQL